MAGYAAAAAVRVWRVRLALALVDAVTRIFF
jgi:hypothetical protein